MNALSSKFPLAAAIVTAVSLPITCAHTIVIASHCVGLTLPGMIELPGSFSGMRSSPIPERGPLASQRTSLAILNSDVASVLSDPCRSTSASCDASAANLFGAELTAWPVRRDSTAAHASVANPAGALRPVPTAVPPSASSRTITSARAIAVAP